MKNKFIFTLVTTLTLFFCSCNQKNALEYNNKIIGEQSLIIEKILAFSKHAGAGNLEMAEKSRKEAEEQSFKSIAVIEKMEVFDKNDKFRTAALNLFKFYAETTKTDYKKILEINKKGDSITEEDAALSGKIVEDLTKKESVLDLAFQSAQTEFAAKYKITIGENKLQKEIDKMQ